MRYYTRSAARQRESPYNTRSAARQHNTPCNTRSVQRKGRKLSYNARSAQKKQRKVPFILLTRRVLLSKTATTATPSVATRGNHLRSRSPVPNVLVEPPSDVDKLVEADRPPDRGSLSPASSLSTLTASQSSSLSSLTESQSSSLSSLTASKSSSSLLPGPTSLASFSSSLARCPLPYVPSFRTLPDDNDYQKTEYEGSEISNLLLSEMARIPGSCTSGELRSREYGKAMVKEILESRCKDRSERTEDSVRTWSSTTLTRTNTTLTGSHTTLATISTTLTAATDSQTEYDQLWESSGMDSQAEHNQLSESSSMDSREPTPAAVQHTLHLVRVNGEFVVEHSGDTRAYTDYRMRIIQDFMTDSKHKFVRV